MDIIAVWKMEEMEFKRQKAEEVAAAKAAAAAIAKANISSATTSINAIDFKTANAGLRGLTQGFGMLSIGISSMLPFLASFAASFAFMHTLKVGKEFEKSMFEIQELAGATTKEMEMLRESVSKLADSTQYGPVQLAEGLSVLTLAGLNATEAMSALVPTLNFASAGGVKLEAAAATLVAVGTAYGYSSDKFTTVADVIAKTAADTMSSVTNMSEAFKTSSVVAQQYGIALDDTARSLGMLAQIGITGTAAGTSYRNMITEFNKGTGRAAEAIQKLSINVSDATGATKPLSAVMRDLTAGLITYSGVAQQRILQDMTTERGAKATAAAQAAALAQIHKSFPTLQAEIDWLQKSGRAAEAKTHAIEAVNKAYDEMDAKVAKSQGDQAGMSFFANLEKQFKPTEMIGGIGASLEESFRKTFEALEAPLFNLAQQIRELFKSDSFRSGLTEVTSLVLSLVSGITTLTGVLVKHADTILAVGAAYVLVTNRAAIMTGAAALATTAMTTGMHAISLALLAMSSAMAWATGLAGALTAAAALFGSTLTISAGAVLAVTAGVVALGVALVAAAAYYLLADTEAEKAAKNQRARAAEAAKDSESKIQMYETMHSTQMEQLKKEANELETKNAATLHNAKITKEMNELTLKASIARFQGQTSAADKYTTEAKELSQQLITKEKVEEKIRLDAMNARIDGWVAAKIAISEYIKLQDQSDRMGILGQSEAGAKQSAERSAAARLVQIHKEADAQRSVANALVARVTAAQKLAATLDKGSVGTKRVVGGDSYTGSDKWAKVAAADKEAKALKVKEDAVLAVTNAIEKFNAGTSDMEKSLKKVTAAETFEITVLQLLDKAVAMGAVTWQKANEIVKDILAAKSSRDFTEELVSINKIAEKVTALNTELKKQLEVKHKLTKAEELQIELDEKYSRVCTKAELDALDRAQAELNLTKVLEKQVATQEAYNKAVEDAKKSSKEALLNMKTLKEQAQAETEMEAARAEALSRGPEFLAQLEAETAAREKGSKALNDAEEVLNDLISKQADAAAADFVGPFNPEALEAQRKTISDIKTILDKLIKDAGINALNKKLTEARDKFAGTVADALITAFEEGGAAGIVALRKAITDEFLREPLKIALKASVSSTMSAVGSAVGSAATSLLPASVTSAAAAVTAPMVGAMVASAMAAYAIGDAIGDKRKVAGLGGGELGLLFGGLPGGLIAQLFGKGEELASTGDASRRYDKGGALTENATNGAWFFTNSQDANKLLDGLESRYQKAAKALGIGTVATQFDYGSNNRGNFALAGAAGNSRANTGEIAYSAEAMQVAASRAVFAALQGSELPKHLSGLLDSVGDINALSQAQIEDVLNTAQAFKGLHDVMMQMPFETLHDLSYNAAKGLVEFSGGLDELTRNLGAYYDNFYSAEEKKAQTLANITKTLTDAGALTKTTRTAIAGEFDVRVGAQGDTSLEQRYATSIENIDMPKTREEFRALAESLQDLGGEAAQKAYAALMSVSGAFASVTPAANDAVAALEKDAAARASWQQKLDLLTGKTTEQQIERANDLAGVTDAATKALIQQVHAQQDLAAAAEKATAAAEKAAATQRAIADAQQSITLSKNTLAGVSSQDNAVVAAKFALQSVIDAITDLGKSVTKDAAYQVTKAQIESVNLSEFAGTEYGAALSELVADYWSAQVQLKEANDAVTAAANQTAVAQTSVADTAMSATAAVATLAEQLGRFGSGLNLRFDLAAGGNKSAAFNTDYLRDIVAYQDQNTANVQSAVAGDPSNTWAQQMLTEAQIAGLTNKVYAAGAAAARLREFFVQMSTEAVNIEQAIADSGTAIGKGVQAVNLSEYFTAFSADLTEAIGVINGAIAGGADAIADSATILASVTTDSSRSYVQAMLDNLAAGLGAVDAADLATMAEAAGGATKIATAITQSVLNSVSEEVKNNPALSGLAGTDQAYISAIVSGVGQNDIQGINDAFLLLSGALTSGRLDAIEYNAALDLVTKGFLSGTTAATNAAEIALQAASFADRLAIATGSKTQLEISRKNELATALDDGNKATLLAIYAAEDLVTAREKDAASATKAAQEASTNATEALAGVQRAVDAQKKLAQVQVDVAQESVANLTSIFDTLKSSVAQLYGGVDSTTQQSAAQGQVFIAQALATAKATGYLPDASELSDAVTAAMQGISSTVYTSQADADFERLKLAGSLSGLKDISKTGLTTAEQALKVARDQLTTLDKTLETARQQLDAANGINTSVLSVATALDLLNTSIADLIAANSAKALADAASTRSTGTPVPPVTTRTGAPDVVAPAHRGTIYEATTGLTALYGPAYLNRLGGTLPDLYAAAKAAGLPGFASGINYVPHDMTARIHEGEAVVPKVYNPFNPNAQGAGNARLEALVEGLTKEVQRLQGLVNDGNTSQRRTADAVNGNPEMPMLVETV